MGRVAMCIGGGRLSWFRWVPGRRRVVRVLGALRFARSGEVCEAPVPLGQDSALGRRPYGCRSVCLIRFCEVGSRSQGHGLGWLHDTTKDARLGLSLTSDQAYFRLAKEISR